MTRVRAALAAVVVVLGALGVLGGCDAEPAEQNQVGGDYGSFFGVVPQGDLNETDFTRMARGGVGSYHLFIAWFNVETTKGSYDWSSYDVTMANLAQNGIEPVPYIFGTPTLYAPKGTDPPTSSPDTFDAWADFLKAATERYGPDGEFWDEFATTNPGVEPQPVRIWEIWNEPNSSVFWTPSPDVDEYAALLKRSARVIRSVDADAEIMTAGMFGTPQSEGAIESFDFIRDLYDHQGMAEVIDVVGVHPYGPDVASVIDQMDLTKEAIDDAGDDAATWVTEIGWGSDPTVRADLAKTPEQQAELLSGSLQGLYEGREGWGLRGAMWFTWHDSSETVGACGWCPTAGLVDADRDSKPAWLAFTDLTGGEP